MNATGKKVLVIGSGGREHALAWKLSTSPQVARIIVAPGNDGFSAAWERWPVDLSQGSAEFERLALHAKKAAVDLVVVGPDNPLAEGIADVLERHGLAVFGPSAQAARIEASKAFAKDVMQAAGIPTARYFLARTESEADKIIRSVPWPPQMGHGWVVKADGLALGKGVVVCSTPAEAQLAAKSLLKNSGQVVIEERLKGSEISWMAFCDGQDCSLLEPARDYKRLLDGDEGPNTGGMGAYSPVPEVPESWYERVRTQVFEPTLAELKKRGTPFKGLLYAGLMIDMSRDRFWVLEFNARFGDPETQVLAPRIADDFYQWCEAAAFGRLAAMPRRVPFHRESAVVVVGASKGYPENPEKGEEIRGISLSAESDHGLPGLFLAGIRKQDGKWLTSGGRVLGAVAMGSDLLAAREKAYAGIRGVNFRGMQYRTDVGVPAR